MAQAKTRAEFNRQVGGIVTDASLIDFAPTASRDEENFILRSNGNRERRFGIDYENNAVLIDTGLSSSGLSSQAVTSHRWETVDEFGGIIHILGVQVGTQMYFFDESAETLSLAPLNGGNAVNIPGDGSREMQTANINNLLAVVNGNTTVTLLDYDADNDVVTLSTINVSIRDIFGIDDGLEIEDRPGTLSAEHRYNLLNQGWNDTQINTFKADSGLYPSNADVVFLGKDAEGTFDAQELLEQFFGSTPAPKGRYIIDLFRRGPTRETRSGVTGLPGDTTTAGFTSVAAFAGRLFYAGGSGRTFDGDDLSPTLASTVAFTQIVFGKGQLGKCYQDADPTSEHVSDLIETDGGTLRVTGAQRIIKLLPLAGALLVFANNGVWQVSGSEQGGGFSATGFQVIQVTDVGPESVNSIVDAENFALFWSKSGIYIISPNEFGTGFVSQNLTENRIQELYRAIPADSKPFVKGVFDRGSRKVRWLYADDETIPREQLRVRYNKELVFDTVINAFTKNDIKSLPNDSPFVSEYVPGQQVGSVTVIEEIVVSGVQVVVEDEEVIAGVSVPNRTESELKYISFSPVSSTMRMGFSLFNNINFKDWFTQDQTGVDAQAFLQTGPLSFGDTSRGKRIQYFYVHLERTEDGYQFNEDGSLSYTKPSGCLAQGRFDHSDSTNSGKWTDLRQVYRLNRNYLPSGVDDEFDYGHEVITSKNKLRGSGRAITIYFQTEPAKDLKLLGWTLSITGETDD